MTGIESIEEFVENQGLIITLPSQLTVLYVYFHILHYQMIIDHFGEMG